MSDEDVKHLVEEFGSKNLGAYLYEHISNCERFNEKKLPTRKCFFSSTKNGKIEDDGKKSKVHISFKDYLTSEKIWDKCDMKNVGDYYDHYLKKDVLLLSSLWWV